MLLLSLPYDEVLKISSDKLHFTSWNLHVWEKVFCKTSNAMHLRSGLLTNTFQMILIFHQERARLHLLTDIIISCQGSLSSSF